MQRSIKYIGWLIETKNHKTTTTTKIGENKPKTETHKTKWETQNRKTLPENRNTNPNTEISIPNRKGTQKSTELNRKTETESKTTNKP